MTTPVWLLDVDGVINANRPGWSAPPNQGYAAASGTTWKMRWAPGLTAAIRTLALSGDVEIRWATSWVLYTDQLERLFRLPPLPVAFADDNDGYVTELKVAAALRVVEEEKRPLIWTDDDAIPHSGPERSRLESGEHPVLLLDPDWNRGLQPTHIDIIREFIGRI